MEYISTDEAEKLDIKHGELTQSRVRGSTARFICNPIVDDIEADESSGRVRRYRVNGRVVIDTTASDGEAGYQPPGCLVVGDASINDLAFWRWQGRTLDDAETERELIRRIQGGDPQCRAGSPRSCFCRSCRAFFDPRPGKISLLPAFHHSIRRLQGSMFPKDRHGGSTIKPASH